MRPVIRASCFHSDIPSPLVPYNGRGQRLLHLPPEIVLIRAGDHAALAERRGGRMPLAGLAGTRLPLPLDGEAWPRRGPVRMRIRSRMHFRAILRAAACRFTHKKPVFIAFGASHTPAVTPPKPHLDPTKTTLEPRLDPPLPLPKPTWTPHGGSVAPTWTRHGTTIANLPAGPANPIRLKSKIMTYEEEPCCKFLFCVS